MTDDLDRVIPKRTYRDEVQLSIIGFGGMLAVGMEQGSARASTCQTKPYTNTLTIVLH